MTASRCAQRGKSLRVAPEGQDNEDAVNSWPLLPIVSTCKNRSPGNSLIDIMMSVAHIHKLTPPELEALGVLSFRIGNALRGQSKHPAHLVFHLRVQPLILKVAAQHYIPFVGG